MGILLGGCLTCEELSGGLLTGDDGVGFMEIDYWSNHPFINFPLMFPSLTAQLFNDLRKGMKTLTLEDVEMLNVKNGSCFFSEMIILDNYKFPRFLKLLILYYRF